MSESDNVRPVVQAFPGTTQRVMEFYQSDASAEEKEMVTKVIQGAAKIIATNKKGDQPKARKAKLFGLPSPEEIAAALYTVLSESPAARVDGNPSEAGYKGTRIEGRFDLNELAQKLLSLGKRQTLSETGWL